MARRATSHAAVSARKVVKYRAYGYGQSVGDVAHGNDATPMVKSVGLAVEIRVRDVRPQKEQCFASLCARMSSHEL